MLKQWTIGLSLASLLTYGCASNASQTPKSPASQPQAATSTSTEPPSTPTQSVAQIDDRTEPTKTASTAKDSFSLAVGMSYAKARQQLIDQGWMPHVQGDAPDRKTARVNALFEHGYEEVKSCAGTGIAPCRFEFINRAGEVLAVSTTPYSQAQGDDKSSAAGEMGGFVWRWFIETKTTATPTEPTPATTKPSSETPPSSLTGSRQDRSWEQQGTASTGETVLLSLDSVQVTRRSLGMPQPPSYFFQYRIGGDRVYGVTACNGEFSTSQDGDRYDNPIKPQSEATQRMLDRVCNLLVKQMQVFSPPSHVRMGANGEIICTIPDRKLITTYGQDGKWFYTDACGQLGMIHSSQIR
jgi:hypothetical protein